MSAYTVVPSATQWLWVLFLRSGFVRLQSGCVLFTLWGGTLIKVGLDSCVPLVVKQYPLTQWFHRLHSGSGCYFYVVVLSVYTVVVSCLLYWGGDPY